VKVPPDIPRSTREQALEREIANAQMAGYATGLGLQPNYESGYHGRAFNTVTPPARLPPPRFYISPEDQQANRRQLGLAMPRIPPDLTPLGIARRRFQASIPRDAPGYRPDPGDYHPGDDTGRGA
jgi:hypothetical protein